MTYGTFDLTEHTQFSIRGTTGTHPDSEFVFGVFITTQKHDIYETGEHIMPDIDVYDDMDWSKAIMLAKWVMDKDESDEKVWTWFWITDNCLVSRIWDNETEDFKFSIGVRTLQWRQEFPLGSFEDRCEWERAVQMAKWILEWDENFKRAKEEKE